MKPVRALGCLLLLLGPLAGCLADDPGSDTVVEGRPGSYGARPDALVLYLDKADGTSTAVVFSRTDWYVAGIQRELENTRPDLVRARGVITASFDVAAEDVETPDSLAGARWDRMPAADRARQPALDREWEAVAARLGDGRARVGTPLDALP